MRAISCSVHPNTSIQVVEMGPNVFQQPYCMKAIMEKMKRIKNRRLYSLIGCGKTSFCSSMLNSCCILFGLSIIILVSSLVSTPALSGKQRRESERKSSRMYSLIRVSVSRNLAETYHIMITPTPTQLKKFSNPYQTAQPGIYFERYFRWHLTNTIPQELFLAQIKF